MPEKFECGKSYRALVSREVYQCVDTSSVREKATLRSSKGVPFEVTQGVRDYYEDVESASPSPAPKAEEVKEEITVGEA